MNDPKTTRAAEDRQRRRLDVRGRVQGVGFRPFVYRLATALKLGGVVGNDMHGAFIEIEGDEARLDRFAERLTAELPPLARISELRVTSLPTRGQRAFSIEESHQHGEQDAELTPDMATCADCLAELLDPADRRFRYPFINCTSCGPRYSIVRSVPYDRPNTTMAGFTMCPRCQAEYDDPADRRFHAQPNACPVCGPAIRLVDRNGRDLPGDAVGEASRMLNDGAILAIKGIGGFHLACRADLDDSVAVLRQRKDREAKPLAVMVASVEVARSLGHLNAAAESALTRPERPIVLVPKRHVPVLSVHIAPGVGRVGLMLPYTPLHHLLFAEGLRALVMTSGNPSDEPLCCENEEALRRLGGIADAFILHNRDIARRVDDAVVIATEDAQQPTIPIRRARGYAPAPLALPIDTPQPLLAVGGEMKGAICLAVGRQAILSEHLGELSNAVAYRHFVSTIAKFKELFRVEPEAVVADLHPNYAATRYARTLGLPVIDVQHHHAHLAAVMAEHGLSGDVIGIIADGTGFGPDRTIWGCELLAGDECDFRRVGHLKPFPLIGADAGARQTWRPAAGLLQSIGVGDFKEIGWRAFCRVPAESLQILTHQLKDPSHLPHTSSLGRLFDAAAFLLGLVDENRYEAEAAMTLEGRARAAHGHIEPLSFEVDLPEPLDGPIILDPGRTLLEMIDRYDDGDPAEELARAFHDAIATMLVEGASTAARRLGIRRVVLSGGCFANAILSQRVHSMLAQRELEVFVHAAVPPGDGGLAFGQAYIGAARLGRGTSSLP